MMFKKSNVREVLLAITTFITIVAAFAVVVFRSDRAPDLRQAFKLECNGLINTIRLSLAASSEAQNSAVMVTDDKDLRRFNDAAKESLEDAEQASRRLSESLARHASPVQQQLHKDFSDKFDVFRNVDGQLFLLANQNTNRQAFSLAIGPMQEATSKIDAELVRLLVELGSLPQENSHAAQLLAGEIRVGVLRIQALMMPHILEVSDSRMDEIEAQMAGEDSLVHSKLSVLNDMDSPDTKEHIQAIKSLYTDYATLKAESVRLSRLNTNIRSALMATQEKRKAMIDCEEALSALEKAIRDEPIQSTIPGGRNQF